MKKPWPKLTETLTGPRRPDACQSCTGESADGTELVRYRECDEDDRPTGAVLVLCKKCADDLIDPHPRLYLDIEPNAPDPGSMPCCAACVHHDGLRCKHPSLKANGGPGLKLTFPQPDVCHVDGRDAKTGRRFGRWFKTYHKPVECAGREVASA